MDTSSLQVVIETEHDLDILRETPDDQLVDAVMIMSPIEAINISTKILDVEDVLENFGIEDDDGTHRSIILRVSVILAVIGEPPPETRITDTQIATQVGRFCRARHQLHYRCPDCGRGVRRAVTWTYEDGFDYPGAPPCGYCTHHVLLDPTGEMYALTMPYPFEFDPESDRTEAWLALEVDDIWSELLEAYCQARRG